MSGLRERKKRRTLTAIHDAAMELFAQHGYGDVTVADIAAAAEVSRATVFAYYPAKEDIVLGEAWLAVDALSAALEGLDDARAIVGAVREWLRPLAGWMEPDLLLQLKIADEFAAVAAARSRLQRGIENVIADALERSLGDGGRLAARLVAGSLAAALVTVEQEAARRMATTGRALAPAEVDRLLDQAVAFVDGGLAGLRGDAAGEPAQDPATG